MPGSPTPLDYRETYPCPLCRRGKLSGLTLVEAFGCNGCSHIFVLNPSRQSVRAVDRSPPLTWRWDGRRWQTSQREDVSLGWGEWSIAMAFVLFPTSIVGLAAYVFPPFPGSPLSFFPILWAVLTFFSHLVCVTWLILEYYQFPILSYFRWRR
ncbi:MAG: hypothetical protein J7641_11905 [Cyanobacteria bacterium SID2]|nr:hypothetical protein [Cyanobacteria bacterium SID2]MBP0003007.1 hypothetical protein [Cyanobacteria bacterium SBC]